MANGYETITIQKRSFKVPVRYAAGHTLTENEAAALNQTYWENLRNNFAGKVSDGNEAGLDDETLQKQLDDYAQDYQFGERRGGGGFRGDPVKTAAMAIAREMVRNAIKAKQLDPDQWPASKVTSTAQALLDKQGDSGTIMTAARQQVEAEKNAANAAMAEVGEVLDQQGQQAA